LEGFVGRDGYTATEDYAAARQLFEEMREDGLKELSGLEREEFEEETRQWAEQGGDDEGR
jgi:pentatricopeptide repeat protein